MPVIFFGGAIGCQILLKHVGRDHGRWQSVYMLVPGFLLLVTGIMLDIKRQPNEFCHLRMIIWGGLSLILGVVILFTG